MSNHFHILLDVPPMTVGGITGAERVKRLSATNSEAFVAVVAKDPAEFRWSSYGEAVGGGTNGNGKKARYCRI